MSYWLERDGRRLLCAACALIVVAALSPTRAWGQLPISSADPARTDKRFDRPPLPLSEPTAEGQVQPVQPIVPGVAPPKGPTFVLKGVRFEGMTAIDPKAFQPLCDPMFGTEVTMADLDALALVVTYAYRNHGYILTRAIVPQQSIADGIVTIRVVEGYVGKVEVRGLGDKPGLAQTMMDKVDTARPLDADTLERYTLLTNDLPGVTAQTVFSPLEGEPGAAQIQVNAERDPVDFLLSVDNRGNRFNGPVQFHAAVGVNSMLRLDDRTYIHGVTTETSDETQLISLDHEQPLGSEGTRLRLTGLYSEQEPGYLLGPVETDSHSYRVTVQVIHPFIRSRQLNVAGRAEFTAYHIETEQLDTLISREDLRSLRVGVTGDWSDQWRGVNVVDVEISQGLNIFGARRSGSPSLSRPNGKSDYTKASVYVSRDQYLAPGWSLALAGAGQVALSDLLASEEFAYGGYPLGRAHDSSEITGDSGLAGSAELRYGRASRCPYLQSWQAYTYFDAGKVWRRSTAFRDSHLSASDLGFGLRLNGDAKRYGSIELAKPLSRGVASQGSDGGHGWRLFFEVTSEF